MKKITLCCFLFCISFFANAQCTISPFIQQNYEFDAKVLALREIQSDVNDPDYDNPYIPQARIDYHLEKLSAIYENPDNNASIDSLFNEFQFHANVEYNGSMPYKKIRFVLPTSVSWLQNLISTGSSGITSLDNFMSQYQFSYLSHYSFNSNGNSYVTLITSNEILNVVALSNDLENVQDILYAYGLSADITDRFNYTGIPYFINGFPIGSESVQLCDIIFDENQNYKFMLGGGDCFAGCFMKESRYVSVSDDCSQVNFSRTLSTEDSELTNVAIYPNPTSSVLNIQGIENIQTVKMYSILGKEINVSLHNSTTVDVSSLKNGVYFLKITDVKNRVAVRKFIKK